MRDAPLQEAESVYAPLEWTTGIAVDDEGVYVGMEPPPTGMLREGLWYGPKDGGGELIALDDAGPVQGVVVVGDYVVYARGSVQRMRVGGGAPTRITTSAGGVMADELVADGDNVYAAQTIFTCVDSRQRRIYEINVQAGSARPIGSGLTCLKYFTVDATHVYYGIGSQASALGYIGRLSKSDGRAEVILPEVDITFGSMAIFEDHIYYIAAGEGTLDSLYKLPLAGGTPAPVHPLGLEGRVALFESRLFLSSDSSVREVNNGQAGPVLARGLGLISGMATDGSHIYLAGGGVARVAW